MLLSFISAVPPTPEAGIMILMAVLVLCAFIAFCYEKALEFVNGFRGYLGESRQKKLFQEKLNRIIQAAKDIDTIITKLSEELPPGSCSDYLQKSTVEELTTTQTAIQNAVNNALRLEDVFNSTLKDVRRTTGLELNTVSSKSQAKAAMGALYGRMKAVKAGLEYDDFRAALRKTSYKVDTWQDMAKLSPEASQLLETELKEIIKNESN
ncbi:MAG TPA: hypothetical protein V6D29_03980 [Leptolyngbyaceae cyanobacterium]